MLKLARGLLAGVVLVTAIGAAGFVRVSRTDQPQAAPRAMDFGFTFSERQADYLDVPWQQAYEAAMDLDPNLVRLGAYWDDVEPQRSSYDFSRLDWLLDNTPSQSAVLLTVGMKAPRWPEYYLPAWLETGLHVPDGADIAADATVRQATLNYIAQVVRHEKDRPNLKYWQVENEPLDASGPHHWYIDPSFLAQEVALVRSLDPDRPVVVNLFVDTSPLGWLPSQRDALQARARSILRIADILGLDIYTVRPVVTEHFELTLTWPSWVWEPRVRALQQLTRSAGKEIWISEAQAEPWLPARLVDTAPIPGGKVSPALTASTIERLQADGFDTILFWGIEYWYMRDQGYQDTAWWSDMLSFFTRPSDIQQGLSPVA